LDVGGGSAACFCRCKRCINGQCGIHGIALHQAAANSHVAQCLARSFRPLLGELKS